MKPKHSDLNNKKNSSNKLKVNSSKQGSQYIGKYHEAPSFLQYNKHILSGYCIGYDSPRKILKTLFLIHNETVNIWTHLIGVTIIIFLLFQGIAYSMQQSHILGKSIIQSTVSPYKQKWPHQHNLIDLCKMLNQDLQPGQQMFECTPTQQQKKDIYQQNEVDQKEIQSDGFFFDDSVPTWPIMLFLVGATLCLGCSVVYHWINPVNQKIFKLSLGIDFAGVSLNMAFSPIPGFYYAMYCDRGGAMVYITIIILAGVASFISNMLDWTHRKENILFKILILSISTITCIVGIAHILIKQFVFDNYGDSYTMVPTLYFLVPAMISYIIGFSVFIARCPQRIHPGRYDICGHSHQIWHLFSFIAIIFTYLGSLASYQIRSHQSSCPIIMGSSLS